MIKKIFNRNTTPVPKTTAAPKSPSTQEWFPIVDIHNGFIRRRDGHLVAAVRVSPVNIKLLSESEQKRKIKSLEEVMNGLDEHFQIMSIARPVDLDAYIASLNEMKINESDRIKNRLLAGIITNAAAMATSGEALERQFYILIQQDPSKRPQLDEQNLYRRANELAANLSGADLQSHVCNDEELRDLLFIFTNPNQAAYERAPFANTMFPTIWD